MTRHLPPPRPCIDCGVQARGLRCRACYYAALPPRINRPPCSWTERKRRKATVDAHRAQFGDWCPGFGVEPHESGRLTADHVIPVGAGGDEDGELQVYCVGCNAAKRDGRRPARNPVRKTAGRAQPRTPPAVQPPAPRSDPPAGEPVHQPAPVKEVTVTETPRQAPRRAAIPKPPTGTRTSGRRLWDSILSKYELEAHETSLLIEMVRCIDMLDQLAAIVERDGPMVPVLPVGEKIHPALIEARQLRITFARLQSSLRLPSGDEDEEGGELRRPQRRGGVRGTYQLRSVVPS